MPKRGESLRYRVAYRYAGQKPGRAPKADLYGAAILSAEILRRGGEVDVIQVDDAKAETLVRSLTTADLPDDDADKATDAERVMRLLEAPKLVSQNVSETAAKITDAQRRTLQLIRDNPGRVVAWQRGTNATGYIQINGNTEHALLRAKLATPVTVERRESTYVPGEMYDFQVWELTETGRAALPVEPESQNPVSQDVEAAPAALAPKTNKASTRAALRNLDTDYRDSFGVKTFRNGQVWEHLSRDRERFERDAKQYLGDKSNLRSSTLNSADWDEIHAYFYPETEQSPEPTPAAVEPSPAAVDFEEIGSTKGTATFGSDSDLGGNLVQIVLSVAALVKDGCTGLRIDSGPLAGHEDALMAAAPALAALHRAQVGERVSAGLAAARADGRKAGRPKALDDATRAALAARVDGGESVTDAAKALGIKRATAYRALPKAK